jgi:NADPH2:quinone reductase
MKALVVKEFGALDSMTLEEVASPNPGADEALVDIHAASVNFPDLLVIQGKYQVLPPLPFSPGKECAGVVRAVGAGVTRVKPGDRVLIQIEYGGYAQQVVAKAVNCHVIPESMSFTEAAAMGLTYMTAHFALVERANIKAGESVLVTGAAGGVGLATVQVAKALGAVVLAAVSSPEKAAAAKAAGADHIIDTSVDNIREALRDQVYAAVGKRGVDGVLREGRKPRARLGDGRMALQPHTPRTTIARHAAAVPLLFFGGGDETLVRCAARAAVVLEPALSKQPEQHVALARGNG